jgi:hypothetical protein
MTETAPPPVVPPERLGPAAARPKGRAKPGFLPTIFASVACFLVVFEFLAFQLKSGNDPALGHPQATAPAARRPTVVDRKLIKIRVVRDPAPQSVPGSSPSALASSATAAPAAATAAPAPAPASSATPAPAAPVTTGAS